MVSVQYIENLAIVDKGTRPQKNDKWKRGAIKNWRPPSTSGPTIKMFSKLKRSIGERCGACLVNDKMGA